MYMVESGNIANQKQNKQKIIQQNQIPNNYYNNYTNPQQQTNTIPKILKYKIIIKLIQM